MIDTLSSPGPGENHCAKEAKEKVESRECRTGPKQVPTGEETAAHQKREHQRQKTHLPAIGRTDSCYEETGVEIGRVARKELGPYLRKVAVGKRSTGEEPKINLFVLG